MEKYIDIERDWEYLCLAQPSDALKEMLVKWEGLINRAYIDGYNDGLDKTPYKTKGYEKKAVPLNE